MQALWEVQKICWHGSCLPELQCLIGFVANLSAWMVNGLPWCWPVLTTSNYASFRSLSRDSYSFLSLGLAVRWEMGLDYHPFSCYKTKEKNLAGIQTNTQTNKQKLGRIPNTDSNHIHSPRGHFMSLCWESLSKASYPVLPGIGLYSSATSRGYVWGLMFLQYSSNNKSLHSLGKWKVWESKALDAFMPSWWCCLLEVLALFNNTNSRRL